MRIANVVLNDFTRDNRVLKISSTLADAGYEVTVVALHKDNLPENEEHPRGFMVRRISLQMPTRLFRGAFTRLTKNIYQPPIERKTACTSRSLPNMLSMLSIHLRASVLLPSAANISAV
jgi:hypothetical protein